MIAKIKAILGSIRFYQVVLAVVAELLATYGIIPGDIAKAIATVLGVSVVIGTVDKVVKK